jgi:pSer/pThr/pTyr-binding forkhead associated (FHA) protein
MSSKLFSLIVSISDQTPVTHELSGGCVSVGRGPDNDIQILVSEVSVKHAELKVDGNSISISDLGSTNGTRVSGETVGEGGVELASKSKIVFGETIPAYLVSVEDLAGSPVEDLIEAINEAEETADPKTEPIAAAVAPPEPEASAAATGASTVKLTSAQSLKAGGVQPPAPAVPVAPKPIAPKVPQPVAPVPLKRPGSEAAPKAVPLPKSPPKP